VAPVCSNGGVGTVLIPELDGAIDATLVQLEEVLQWLCAETDDDGGQRWWDPPSGLQGRPGDEVAVIAQAVWSACSAEGRLFAPDERVEHLPIRVVDVEEAQLEVMAGAVQAVGLGNAAGNEIIAEALANFGDLVERATRVHGILTLPHDDSARILADRLGTDPDADVVLDLAREFAYQRVSRRMMAMWYDEDPFLASFYSQAHRLR